MVALGSYLHKAIVEEHAKNRGTHAWFSSDSLPHNIADDGLKIAASSRIEVYRELPIGKVVS